MSLLLEALKKAEKAKEEAQRRAKGEPAVRTPLELQADGVPAEPRRDTKPVLTRAELPDISQPLEILSEDFGSRPRTGPAEVKGPFAGARAAAVRPQASAGEPATEAAAREVAEQSERSAAKKVFEAKFKEPDPRVPFYLTLGALGLFALGVVGYFWYQLRPPSSLVNLNPAQAATREAVASAPPPFPPAPASSPVAPAPSAIPGLPAASPAAPRQGASATPAIPRANPQPRLPDSTPAAPSMRPEASPR